MAAGAARLSRPAADRGRRAARRPDRGAGRGGTARVKGRHGCERRGRATERALRSRRDLVLAVVPARIERAGRGAGPGALRAARSGRDDGRARPAGRAAADAGLCDRFVAAGGLDGRAGRRGARAPGLDADRDGRAGAPDPPGGRAGRAGDDRRARRRERLLGGARAAGAAAEARRHHHRIRAGAARADRATLARHGHLDGAAREIPGDLRAAVLARGRLVRRGAQRARAAGRGPRRLGAGRPGGAVRLSRRAGAHPLARRRRAAAPALPRATGAVVRRGRRRAARRDPARLGRRVHRGDAGRPGRRRAARRRAAGRDRRGRVARPADRRGKRVVAAVSGLRGRRDRGRWPRRDAAGRPARGRRPNRAARGRPHPPEENHL